MSTYQLYHGDCLDILPTLEAGSVDAVITDPPYGTTACKWDNVIPFEPMWAGIKHVRKQRAAVALFGSEPFSSLLRVSNLKEYKYDWVWDKKHSGNFATARFKPLSVHEDILIFFTHNYKPIMRVGKKRTKGGGGKCAINGMVRNHSVNGIYYPTSIIKFSNAQRTGDHPTQKPVSLIEYLIKTYTTPGDTVLDFTMGSGTTGVACMRTGRNFIGIELDAEYFKIAETRIRNANNEFTLTEKEKQTGQLALFDGAL